MLLASTSLSLVYGGRGRRRAARGGLFLYDACKRRLLLWLQDPQIQDSRSNRVCVPFLALTFQSSDYIDRLLVKTVRSQPKFTHDVWILHKCRYIQPALMVAPRTQKRGPTRLGWFVYARFCNRWRHTKHRLSLARNRPNATPTTRRGY